MNPTAAEIEKGMPRSAMAKTPPAKAMLDDQPLPLVGNSFTPD